MDKNYGGVIWTNHALSRMKQRGIKQGDAWATWRRPDQSRYAKARGAWVYYKTYGDQKIEVVAKQNERKKWIILSVWSQDVSREPRLAGSRPAFVKRKKTKSFRSLILEGLFGKKNTRVRR